MDFDSNLVDFNVWDSLADANGGITIRRSFPNNTDTASLASRTYELNFGDYVKTAAIIVRLGSTSICERATYRNRCISLLELPNEPGLVPRNGISDAGGIVTSGDFPTRRQHELGLLQGYYEVDLPMAWEITKGNNGVYAGVSDYFSDPDHTPQPHTDLKYYTTSDNGVYGNFYHQTGIHSGNVKLSNLYVDQYTSSASSAKGHGYQILNQIAAQQNDQGLIGVAPKVRVFATMAGSDYSDLDLLPEAGIQVPHVMNCSFFGYGSWSDDEGTNPFNLGQFYKSMRSGVVLVGSLDNNRDADYEYTDNQNNPANFGSVTYLDEDYIKYMIFPKIDSPGGNVYRDPVNPSDPSKDIRVLTVLGYDRNVTSNLGACNSPFNQEMNFDRKSNFSLGIEKFSTASSIETRLYEKNQAAVDVLAPRNLVRATYEDGVPKYIDGNPGNSFAIPHVTGIVALMMSVHDRLGRTGFDVQRRVYDIVTFRRTRFKIPG
ncbi:MAG: hypothetical protein IPF79_09060 [Ignavibacteria bacterium]|nr:hypothetical protein [Ignavibacteria bacterium]